MNSYRSESVINLTTMNHKEKDFLDMDLEKIRDIIQILREHQEKSVLAGKLADAEMSRLRLIQFRKIEDDKIQANLNEAKLDEKKKISDEEEKCVDQFNIDYDNKFMELDRRWDESRQELEEYHNKKLSEAQEMFQEFYPTAVKYSSKLLNDIKMLNGLVKTEQFSKGHLLQLEIAELTKKEDQKWLGNKDKKKNLEMEKLRKVREHEMNALILKRSNCYSEFKKKRATDYELLIKKFKNKLWELDKNPKFSKLAHKKSQIAIPTLSKNNTAKNGYSMTAKKATESTISRKNNYSSQIQISRTNVSSRKLATANNENGNRPNFQLENIEPKKLDVDQALENLRINIQEKEKPQSNGEMVGPRSNSGELSGKSRIQNEVLENNELEFNKYDSENNSRQDNQDNDIEISSRRESEI